MKHQHPSKKSCPLGSAPMNTILIPNVLPYQNNTVHHGQGHYNPTFFGQVNRQPFTPFCATPQTQTLDFK